MTQVVHLQWLQGCSPPNIGNSNPLYPLGEMPLSTGGTLRLRFGGEGCSDLIPLSHYFEATGLVFFYEPIEPGDEYMRWCAVVVNAHLCERFMPIYIQLNEKFYKLGI